MDFVAQAFATFELQMDILASSEEQKAKLESDYQNMLAIHDVVDTLQIKEHKKIHDI